MQCSHFHGPRPEVARALCHSSHRAKSYSAKAMGNLHSLSWHFIRQFAETGMGHNPILWNTNTRTVLLPLLLILNVENWIRPVSVRNVTRIMHANIQHTHHSKRCISCTRTLKKRKSLILPSGELSNESLFIIQKSAPYLCIYSFLYIFFLVLFWLIFVDLLGFFLS